MLKVNPPDAYWKKDVALFFGKRFALVIKMLYPMALIVPVAASDIPAQYAAAVIGIVAIMAGTFGAGESLTIDLNDGILMRVALTPLSPRRIVFEVLAVNAVLDFIQLLPALLLVYAFNPAPLVWVLAATFGVFATLVTANCLGIFIANFTSSPADVLLYATATLAPLIYLSGFFRNQNPTGVLATLRDFVPFAYMNDALKAVFGLATRTTPLEVFVYPALICAILAAAVCLTAPRLLTPRF
jgi:ABC-2 type transport system permease protein